MIFIFPKLNFIFLNGVKNGVVITHHSNYARFSVGDPRNTRIDISPCRNKLTGRRKLGKPRGITIGKGYSITFSLFFITLVMFYALGPFSPGCTRRRLPERRPPPTTTRSTRPSSTTTAVLSRPAMTTTAAPTGVRSEAPRPPTPFKGPPRSSTGIDEKIMNSSRSAKLTLKVQQPKIILVPSIISIIY